MEFKDVENLGILKRFQRSLRSLTGLCFDFVDISARPSVNLRASQDFSPFCRLIHSTPSGRRACVECNIAAVKKCFKLRKPIIYNCHLGLVDIVVPLIVKGVGIGVLTSGQFLFSKPVKRTFDRVKPRILQLDINLRTAWNNYSALRVIDKSRAKDIVALISIIVEYVVEAESKILELRETYHKDILRQAQQYIESEYKKSISLNNVASVVHISASRLAHIIRDKLNTNFTSYLNEVRIEKAKFLLSNTKLSIKEIAYNVGFQNLSHFNHLFKRVADLSPSEYRRQ